MIRITCVCGARPNFMKIAPLVAAFRETGRIESQIVHTGQHYDPAMNKVFFENLRIPEPDVNLEVGSGSHAAQTAEIMRRFEPILMERRPDWVVVVGDVNSTIACALVASKLNIRVAHVEAGLRSFDRSMPEEINRLLTDAISDLLLVSEQSGIENLRREGVTENKIRFVGNVMIDTLMQHRTRAGQSSILETHGLSPKQYAVVTLHRPSNVDTPETLASILDAFEVISKDMPIIFPMHPRTVKNIAAMGLDARVESLTGLKTPEPLGYLDFLKLMDNSCVVLTDSGGIQEETTILGVPCLTLRENTERPVTITHGTNRLCGSSAQAILAAFAEIKSGGVQTDRTPELWDGRAAERIARIFVEPSPD
ncbi:MAG: UDP-N-acetylglucosamine 2-epimerase (non-hydrolyzing) [Planctomycetota bacterium]|nr:UDP-N-acetylglucosamine 2-epimerase (non-hydrolyzing) [Planctomycetota bacterium]